MILGNELDLNELKLVSSMHDFKNWVRFELRKKLPHAAFLATIGKLYGIGSVPTHRINVDFPLNIIEELKNGAGALDDPTMYGWFKSARLRFINLQNVAEYGAQQQWRRVLINYGMRSVFTHGILDHEARRFATFQIYNCLDSSSQDTYNLLNNSVDSMAKAAWAAVANSAHSSSKYHVGHPTLSLTATELHIVELLAQGLSNKEIARRRGVSDSTIKTQVQRTGAKVGATRRAEIVAIAMPMLTSLPAQTLRDYGDV